LQQHAAELKCDLVAISDTGMVAPGLGTFTYAIYDRWGQIIFEGDEAHPWPGTYKDSDRLIPEGVYVYRVDLKDDKFDPKVVAGRVTLIR
jgi:hypothetical protein